ncbi:HNH endonuclease signature motif containing protein [Barrientosiimonas endolithica]|uniref:HNH endonuclease signature motif containing protein n=1 Tax=Barrientosiimonas endolithica TaxID=1535208 RepID=UPI00259B23E4|nr:HNH endonuclease signature motif containing protein [Barrientosiimonas endolithica]
MDELLADLTDKVPDRVPTAWMHRVADQLRRAERTRSVVEESLIRLLDHHDIPTDRPDSDPPSSNHAQNLDGLDLAGLDKQAPAPGPSRGPDTRPAPSGAPPAGLAPRDARLTIAHVPGTVLLDLTTSRTPDAAGATQLRPESEAAAAAEPGVVFPADHGAAVPDEHDESLPPIRDVLHRPGSIDHVQIPGLGVIPADVITAILRAGSLTLSRALLDTTTGALLTGPSPARTPYKPSHALAEAIRLRDGTCRFPGCTRPAEHADIDHVNPYDADNPDAQTTGSNLQCLCRTHHRAKQSGAWTVTMTPDGICTWTAITGEQRFTYPQHADLLDAPPPF